MIWQKKIVDIFLWAEDYFQNLLQALYAKYEYLYTVILREFGWEGFVILGLFALFLVLIIIIYIKSVRDTFSAAKAETSDSDTVPDGLYYTIDDELSDSANDNEPETPLYDTEEKEKLEQERMLSAEIVRVSRETDDYLNLKRDYDALKQKMQEHAQNMNIQKNERNQPNAPEQNNLPTGRSEDLVALILNLLGRGVSETKIMQALYFYYKSSFKEEDIFQIVRAVRDFLGLCNAGKFDILPTAETLPRLDEALYALAQGKSAQCLILLQALLNYQMELADSKSGVLQDLDYAIAANYACLIGNIARLNDHDLAHDSFELATELSPKNVRAWTRLGDMYMLENQPEKALIAFQNVLDIGDQVMYAPQIADAQQYLASYFKKIGINDKADNLQAESDRFYDIYGIRTPLSPAESTVFQTILNRNKEDLQSSISALLHWQR